jgi:hypothetical protein
MTTLSRFPLLFKAFELMLIDNCAQVTMIQKSLKKAATMEVDQASFTAAEADLKRLTDDEFETLMMGDQDEAPKVAEATQAVLTFLFESL